MGLPSLPSPSEGILTVLLVNTALSVSLLKQILRSILGSPVLADPSLADRLRPVRFGLIRSGCAERVPDCRVCLCRFEPESLVSQLPCGHLFHRGCVETWLGYHHATCPLCRTRVLPDDPEPVWF